jgi:hypothetical protein
MTSSKTSSLDFRGVVTKPVRFGRIIGVSKIVVSSCSSFRQISDWSLVGMRSLFQGQPYPIDHNSDLVVLYTKSSLDFRGVVTKPVRFGRIIGVSKIVVSSCSSFQGSESSFVTLSPGKIRESRQT